MNLGWIHYSRGKVDSAANLYLTALESEPQNSIALCNLALVYLVQGRIEEASAAYGSVIATHGTQEPHRIGAVDDLRDLVGRGVRAGEALEILNTYWP